MALSCARCSEVTHSEDYHGTLIKIESPVVVLLASVSIQTVSQTGARSTGAMLHLQARMSYQDELTTDLLGVPFGLKLELRTPRPSIHGHGDVVSKTEAGTKGHARSSFESLTVSKVSTMGEHASIDLKTTVDGRRVESSSANSSPLLTEGTYRGKRSRRPSDFYSHLH